MMSREWVDRNKGSLFSVWCSSSSSSVSVSSSSNSNSGSSVVVVVIVVVVVVVQQEIMRYIIGSIGSIGSLARSGAVIYAKKV